jgi:DNA-binding CsgD family transcriptional regulator/tetratricopeptide (TPR) repeat protein
MRAVSMDKGLLVGRGRELEQLSDLLRHGQEQGAALTVFGEAGIGKSALLGVTADQAVRAGFVVLSAAGVPAEAHIPFAGLHQLLRPLLGRVDSLPVRQRTALAAAFGDDDGHERPDRLLVSLAALNVLVGAASEFPVLVVVDDLQWMDEPTRDVVRFVARRVGGDPIAVLMAVRMAPYEWTEEHESYRLDLDGLADAAADRLLARHAADLSVPERARLRRAAGGNPLALVELPVAWRSAADPYAETVGGVLPVTKRLERVFAGRARDMPGDTKDALLVAAVDEEGDLAEVLRAAEMVCGRRLGADVFDSACAAGLVVVDVSCVRFRHPLIRSAVLGAAAKSRRRRAHSALAAVLMDQPYRRTWHQALSVVEPDESLACDLAGRAAEAMRRGGSEAAVAALERAAQLTPDPARRGHRLLLAARRAFDAGRRDEVDRLLRAAQRVPLSRVDRARCAWAREIFDDGVPVAAPRVLEVGALAHRCAEDGEPDLAVDLLLAVAMRLWWTDPGEAARERLAAAVRLLPAFEQDARVVATIALACPVRGAPDVMAALDTAQATRCEPGDARLLGIAAYLVGDPVRADELLAASEAGLRAQGRLGLLPQLLSVRVQVCMALGDVEAAVVAAQAARRVAPDTGQPVWGVSATVGAAMIAAMRGDGDEALAIAAAVEREINEQQIPVLLAYVQLARGWAMLGAGRYAEAYEAVRMIFDGGHRTSHGRETFAAVGCLAEAAALSGRQDAARAAVDACEVTAASTPSPLLHGELRLARALLAGDAGDAEVLFGHALRADLSRWPLCRARTQLAYGGWLRRQRRVTESRGPLRAALAGLEFMGAAPWLARARNELRAAGEQHGPDRVDPVGELSARELRIAQFVARGMTNRDIGQQMFLSPRTIQSTLYRMFPKLQVTSRAQVAARLAGHDGGETVSPSSLAV